MYVCVCRGESASGPGHVKRWGDVMVSVVVLSEPVDYSHGLLPSLSQLKAISTQRAITPAQASMHRHVRAHKHVSQTVRFHQRQGVVKQ